MSLNVGVSRSFSMPKASVSSLTCHARKGRVNYGCQNASCMSGSKNVVVYIVQVLACALVNVRVAVSMLNASVKTVHTGISTYVGHITAL